MIETDIRELNEKIQRESQFLDLINLEMNKVIVGLACWPMDTSFSKVCLA